MVRSARSFGSERLSVVVTATSMTTRRIDRTVAAQTVSGQNVPSCAVLHNVAAVVGDHVAAFELGVLSEVFGLDRSADGLPRYNFAVCAVRPGLVPTTSGYAIRVEHGLERLAEADLIAVPAWSDRDCTRPEQLVTALHEALGRGSRVLGICSAT